MNEKSKPDRPDRPHAVRGASDDLPCTPTRAPFRRDTVLALLQVSRARPRGYRPCARCDEPCRCRPTRGCTCRCAAPCEVAAERLLPEPAPPVEASLVPIAFSLACLGGVRVCSAVRRTTPERHGAPLVGFRPDPPTLAELLLCWIDASSREGRLERPWSVVAHARGTDAVWALEPARPADDADTEADLAYIAEHVLDGVRAVAALRLEAEWLGSDRPKAVLDGLRALTEREREILARMLDGESIASISQACFISEHTARNHVKNVAGKLGVASTQAIRDLFAP